MNGINKYKHIFFDLDHTLWDFDSNAKETLYEIHELFKLQELGVTSFDEFFPVYLNHNAILWDRYHKGFITADELKWRRMWRTLLDFKIGDEVLAKNISSKFLDILPTKTLVFEHTFEILDYLQAKNYGIHLITNGFENTQHSKLRHSSLTKYFTHIITSEASSYVKPAKEIFEYAIDKAGANLKECIMIGDNQDADIQGAINAGMDSVFVNHINASISVKALHTIYHLKELESIL